MNLIELDRALRQLRLGGMAAVLEIRLRQAQAEPLAPIDLLSCLVSDELVLRGERLLERRKKQAQFRDSHKTLDNFDFNFNKKIDRPPGLRSGRWCLHRSPRRRPVLGPPAHRQEPLGPGHRPGRNPTGLSRAPTAKLIPCWMSWPMLRSMAPAKNTWSSW